MKQLRVRPLLSAEEVDNERLMKVNCHDATPTALLLSSEELMSKQIGPDGGKKFPHDT